MKDFPFRVLIVDDDDDVLFATKRIAAKEGCEVQTAQTADACRQQMRNHRPDLLLLDVVLGDEEGTKLCREFKSDSTLKETFILLLSGVKISGTEQADGLDCGADGYISRPISNVELRARIRAAFRIIAAERSQRTLIAELEKALAKVKRLTGLLPMCAYCRKIRDDKGYWQQIETYLREHSEAEMSHSICPECAKIHYPDLTVYED